MLDGQLSPVVLPYTKLVGQEDLKLALELAYIAPRVGGVLISGHRGTGKSTAVRAFSQMMYGQLPTTLPINATEDRVVGGWKVDDLVAGKAVPQMGLLERANEKGLLYVDEVNLLDDHIVNIILDVTATGILEIQRDGRNETKDVRFTLVGTMNPEEGELRPQLLDRFGLMINVRAEKDSLLRAEILRCVLEFDAAIAVHSITDPHPFIVAGLKADEIKKNSLAVAKSNLYQVEVPNDAARKCVKIAQAFNAIGHRGDYVMALAARALAARDVTAQPVCAENAI